MELQVLTQINDISATDWNTLSGIRNPFIRHEFLAALENNGAVGQEFGWLPQHLALYSDKQLIGAMPLYLKNNSYGEFVFDWSWAGVYERAGLNYYPKLVTSIPYTPATGPRLLVHPQAPDANLIKQLLVQGGIDVAQRLGVSSWHCLFSEDEDTSAFEQQQLMRRVDCQFHWHNQGYKDFDHYLSHFVSKKRKQIKRERRTIVQAGIKIRTTTGAQCSDQEWRTLHQFYESTFDKRGGLATLSLGFFQEVSRTMGDQVLLFIASKNDQDLACAICFRGEDGLYGRHWGCDDEHHNLHFETCYYQGLDYCIKHQLKYFEPGAQGEHKIWRGFLPTATHSTHWIAQPEFRQIIDRFLHREREDMQDYIEGMMEHSPFKRPDS